jgi:hypothetical protein
LFFAINWGNSKPCLYGIDFRGKLIVFDRQLYFELKVIINYRCLRAICIMVLFTVITGYIKSLEINMSYIALVGPGEC